MIGFGGLSVSFSFSASHNAEQTIMKRSLFILVFNVITNVASAYFVLDTLLQPPVYEERVLNLDSHVANLKSTIDELRGQIEMLESSQDSMAVTLAKEQHRTEENKEAAASALWKSRQNSSELDKFEEQLDEFEEKQATQNESLFDEISTVQMTVAMVKEEVSTTGAKLQSEADRIDSEMSSQGQTTAIGIGLALLLLALASFALYRFTNSSAANTQKSVADDIEASKKAMAEQLIDVDQKLVEALSGASLQGDHAEDHSLALKVADEVTRIESNLARMDESVKGHKQLSRSVANVKSNLQASGYEVIEMLGKPYKDGMIVEAEFTINESLPEGERIITRIKKPEVRFNGEVIQVGKITVSQG